MKSADLARFDSGSLLGLEDAQGLAVDVDLDGDAVAVVSAATLRPMAACSSAR